MIFSGKFSLDGKLAQNIESLIDFFELLDKDLPKNSPLRQHGAYKAMARHKKIERLITVGQAGKGRRRLFNRFLACCYCAPY